MDRTLLQTLENKRGTIVLNTDAILCRLFSCIDKINCKLALDYTNMTKKGAINFNQEIQGREVLLFEQNMTPTNHANRFKYYA